MPVLPGLTDSEEDLDALFGAAREAGAQWVAANVLFLMPASWGPFIAFIDEKFPKLARQYREWYRGYGYAPDSYKQQIKTLVERLRLKHGLGKRCEDVQKRSWVSPQIELGLTTGGERCQQAEGHEVPEVIEVRTSREAANADEHRRSPARIL